VDGLYDPTADAVLPVAVVVEDCTAPLGDDDDDDVLAAAAAAPNRAATLGIAEVLVLTAAAVVVRGDEVEPAAFTPADLSPPNANPPD